MGTPQSVLGQPGRELLAHQCVPEAVAPPRALEHAGRLGLAERFSDAIGARERHQRRLREAVLDYGESGEQRLAEPLEPLEPLRDDLAQAGGHRDLAGGVHRRGQLLREERVTRRRTRDGVEGSRRQRPGGRALGHGCEGAAVERTERQLDRGPAPEEPRSHERRGLGEWLIADRGDHEHALAGAAARKVMHKRRRCLVSVVQVIDRQHHTPFRGGLPQ